MGNLANYIKNNFDGILVFGDIHSDYESLMRSHKFAESHNYFFMSLGDLVDRGPFPFETISHMSAFVKAKRAGVTIGNHDDKFCRFQKGSKVSFSADAKRTLADVGPERQEEFLQMYVDLMETPEFSGLYHVFDDIILVHAASHPCMWNSEIKCGNEGRSRALYGEVNNESDSDGFPVRLYSWVDEIPMGKTVVVGHDRAPIHNVRIIEPLIKTNINGGKAIFIDTGCGKGGFLSGMIIIHDNGRFKFDRFIDFK